MPLTMQIGPLPLISLSIKAKIRKMLTAEHIMTESVNQDCYPEVVKEIDHQNYSHSIASSRILRRFGYKLDLQKALQLMGLYNTAVNLHNLSTRLFNSQVDRLGFSFLDSVGFSDISTTTLVYTVDLFPQRSVISLLSRLKYLLRVSLS